ncbi:MAG: DUF2442 domain-containing protein, partial [Bacteroidota bacterium]
MEHPIYRVLSFEHVAPHTLRVEFDDATKQTINFLPVLKGELYGPLQELKLFDEVSIDPEVHTLVWSNGADFDPATQMLPVDQWLEIARAALAMTRALQAQCAADYDRYEFHKVVQA